MLLNVKSFLKSDLDGGSEGRVEASQLVMGG